MAYETRTARLIPSRYELSNTTYLSISNPSNMYANTDSTTYATVTHNRASTTNYYLLLYGFDFSSIPSNAIINSYAVKLKARASGLSTSTSYRPAIQDAGTNSPRASNCPVITTSTQILTVTSSNTSSYYSVPYSTLSAGLGLNGIRINLRRASSSTTCYVYIYGAEVEVNYSVPLPAVVTTTLTGDGTISPSGTTNTYDGEKFNLIITPTNITDTVTATQDGVDITSSLIPKKLGVSRTLGTYTKINGWSQDNSPDGEDGEDYFINLTGRGYDALPNDYEEDGYIFTSENGYYIDDGDGFGHGFQYDMSMSVPSNATVSRCYLIVKGKGCGYIDPETDDDDEGFTVQLKSGSTELSQVTDFKYYDQITTLTVECNVIPTATQLADMVLECKVGAWGGIIYGATCFVEYNFGEDVIDHYEYSYTVDGDSTINVVIVKGKKLYVLENGTWVEYSKVYVKVNGSWVEQDKDNVFNVNSNYIKAVIT